MVDHLELKCLPFFFPSLSAVAGSGAIGTFPELSGRLERISILHSGNIILRYSINLLFGSERPVKIIILSTLNFLPRSVRWLSRQSGTRHNLIGHNRTVPSGKVHLTFGTRNTSNMLVISKIMNNVGYVLERQITVLNTMRVVGLSRTKKSTRGSADGKVWDSLCPDAWKRDRLRGQRQRANNKKFSPLS